MEIFRPYLIKLLNLLLQHAPVLPVISWAALWRRWPFLINECARPYQRALLGQPNVIQGLNFHGERNRYTRRDQTRAYFLDSNARFYRDGVADFVRSLNAATDGRVIRRLAAMFSHIYIDELQDLKGYDLDVVDLLFNASFGVTAVGDPRQHILRTNNSRRQRQYQGTGLMPWLQQRRALCDLEFRTVSSRCNQSICDWADALYPDLAKTDSSNAELTGHDGVFMITRGEVPDYIAQYKPVILRHQRTTDTLDLPAINMGWRRAARTTAC